MNIMENKQKIFFTSDIHYGHKNICYGVSSWPEKESNCRMFNTLEGMNTAIVKSINSVVGENDILYHLGDWSFGGLENIWHLRKQIKCHHIIKVIGNHDEHIKKDKFLPFLEKQDNVIYELSDKNDFHTLSITKKNGDVSAWDLFEKVIDGTGNEGIEIEIENQKIILNHYPLKTWKGINDGTWLLYGHEHGRFKNVEDGKMIDVGWCRFRKPLSFFEIKEIMDKREIKSTGINKTH